MNIQTLPFDFHGTVFPVIQRASLLDRIRVALDRSPVVVLTGPRQVGKTTLARTFLSEHEPGYFDLEDPQSLARLEEPRPPSSRSRAWSSSTRSSGARTCFRCCGCWSIDAIGPRDS